MPPLFLRRKNELGHRHEQVGGVHDCPFRHARRGDVEALLTGTYGLSGAAAQAALAAPDPRTRCRAAFDAVHGTRGGDVFQVPYDWTDLSQALRPEEGDAGGEADALRPDFGDESEED